MRSSVDKLTQEALALPAEARAILADRLAESLDPLLLDEALRTLWAAEAQKRLEEVRSGKVKTLSAKAVLARVRKSLEEGKPAVMH